MATDPRYINDSSRSGTTMRDAAVTPRPQDYLAPTNAGVAGEWGNPHGIHVQAPGVHDDPNGRALVPGDVDPDPRVQEEAEYAGQAEWQPWTVGTKERRVTFPENEALLYSTKPTFAGTGTPGTPLVIDVKKGATVVVTKTITPSPAGRWSYTHPTALTTGDYTIGIHPVNGVDDFPIEFTVDPALAPSTLKVLVPENGTSPETNVPTISGKADANAAVVVKVTAVDGTNGNQTGNVTASAQGVWSYTCTALEQDAAYKLRVESAGHAVQQLFNAGLAV